MKIKEETYQFIFNLIPCIIFLLDENKNVIEVNEQIKMLGFEIEELKGKNLFDLPIFISKSDVEKLFENKNISFNIGILTKKREKKTASIQLTQSRENFILMIHDITEEEILKTRLKEENELLKEWFNLAEQSLAGVYIYDENLNFIYINPSAINILEYEKDEIIGKKKVLDIVYEEDRDKVKKLIEKRFKGELESAKFYVRIKTKTGKIKYCYAGGKVANYKDRKVIMGTIIDITDRIEYEENFKKEHQLLQDVLNGTIYAFSKIVESRDPYTETHQLNVSKLAEAIGKELGYKNEQIREIIWASLLHDIGKISVPSEILVLPRKLTNLEFDIIKMHPLVGYNVLKVIPTFEKISKIVLQHHERLDGSGYPAGIKGEKILKESRILSVADVVEAMVSHRPYRSALTIDKALEEIYNNKGKKYDEEVVLICIELITKKNFTF
ncbi:MAG: PAS domain S-box protein [Candidatus Omnitrophica bacterium]|nr:PAS domain S-box protein [Candidatus Omnitrophota bacterium]